MKLIFKGLAKGVILSLFLPVLAGAQEHPAAAKLAGFNTGSYRTIERSDWSRYDNGKYMGHVYREVRATLNPKIEGHNQGLLYQGNFFVLEETLKDLRQSARAVNDVVPVSFQIFPSGDVRIDEDRGFPSLRGFPSFPAEAVRPGSRWIAQGVRVVDPLNEGFPVAVPFAAEYEYQGIEDYREQKVHRISAKYASRYSGFSGGGGRCFNGLQGSHTVDILLRVSDGLPLLMRDNLDETFSWPGGNTVRFRGFTLTFGEGTIPLNTDRIIASISSGAASDKGSKPVPAPVPRPAPAGAPAAKPAPAIPPVPPPPPPDKTEWEKTTNIEITAVPEGLRLTVKDIRFAPDSDEFLAAEYPRLDKIAEALKQAPDRTFLVEGHTAAIGRPQGEMELSIQRAKRMVDELVRRGIGADRFLYKGWGGGKPLGDNSTEEGRSLNRRVEITILE